MRPSSVPLVEAFIEGATPRRRRRRSTSGSRPPTSCYFASGSLDAPAAMFTASHNPAQYNGIKLCRAGAAPVGEDTGLRQIKAVVAAGLLERAEEPGRVERRDLLDEFVDARPLVRRRSTRCARCGSSPTPPTAWAASSSPRCSRACRSSSRSSSASSTARSRTTPPTRSSPRT